ncbi:MAG TPA: hypothetical protein VH599_03920 [Ktedonobacterales bacterium]|jgi:hypothetical protein
MNILVMGHLLLGFLTAVAILVNLQLVRLGRRYRSQHEMLPPAVASLLIWLPLAAAVMVAGGVALGESSLLSYHDAQDVGELSWFVVGACLSIFADLCAAMTWITVREALKVTDATDDLETALVSLGSQDMPSVIERDEQ